jgi:hypothetical protein
VSWAGVDRPLVTHDQPIEAFLGQVRFVAYCGRNKPDVRSQPYYGRAEARL